MKCFKCKKIIEVTDRFCPYCGAKQGFEQEVIDRAIKGESEAQEELYNNTYSDVYYTIWAITKDEDLLFDVLQDTYLTAFQKLGQLNNADSFRPWIKRIAHNKTLNALRDRKPSKMTFLVSADTEEVIEIKDDRIENMPEEKMDQKETERLVKEILDELPEDQRVVIGMYYFEQMSISQIAEELGCSGNTIKSRLNYGRKKIETKVLELEKQGTKLYSLMPIPFFLWQLQSLAKQPDKKLFVSVRMKLQHIETEVHTSSDEIQTEGRRNIQKEEITDTPDNTSKNDWKLGKTTKKATEKQIGKAAVVVGKSINVRILAGVATVAVIAGTAGYMVVQQKNDNTVMEQNSEQEDTQKQTEQKTVEETQEESEVMKESETITESETATERETQMEKKQETALSNIENLGYTYIGGTSYDVTYHTGHPYQENGPEAGISLKAAPTGVVGAMKRDMDGDGKEELLLAVLKPAEQAFLNNGKTDAKLYFEVYSEEDKEWVLQCATTEEQAYAVHLTEVIPNIKVVCAGTTIYVRESGNGTFPADPANNGEKYEYNGAGFTALSNSDMGYMNGQISDEIVNTVDNSSMEDLLCEFIIPEIYEQNNRDLLDTLYSGVEISVTLELRDNGWIESDSDEKETDASEPEEESEKIIEIGSAATENTENDNGASEAELSLYKTFLTDYYNNASNNAYYLLLDIDQNGTPELFLMDDNQLRGAQGYSEYEIMTIQNHQIVDVGELYDRDREAIKYNQKKLGVVSRSSGGVYIDWELRYFEGEELRTESLMYDQYEGSDLYNFSIVDRNFEIHYEDRDITAEEYNTIYSEDFNEADIEQKRLTKLTPEEIDRL